MNTQRTGEQIEFYRENGFLVIDDFLTGAELSVWQDAVDEAIMEHVSRDDAYHNQKGEGNYYKDEHLPLVFSYRNGSTLSNQS